MCGGVPLWHQTRLRFLRLTHKTVFASLLPHYQLRTLSPSRRMEPVNAKSSADAKAHNTSRMVTLLGSVLVALSSGTNYVGQLETA